MSQNSRANVPPRPASVSNDSSQASETSVRQLIANGKFKIALDNAKQFHKAQGTAASERLLLDAYTARIQSLLDQNLATEANSLLELVRDRFPSAKERFDALKMAASARKGELAGLLQPLNDPDLNIERRAVIEQIIQTQVTDLMALADCASLPPEHSLRLAAAVLGQAFHAATSGPVTEEQIALPEVSRRSPLAPWKLLIRAIACLQRGGDEECREYLAAIQPETVPARLVPAMRAMLGAKTAAALKPAEAALISRTAVSLLELRNALANLDRAFTEAAEEGPIFKAVRAAVRECRRSAPDQLDKLKQLITVRGGVAGLDDERLLTALEGAARRDAAFFRMYARAMENSDDPEDLGDACKLWDDFRQQAVRENWFHDKSVEVATLYLHMADVLGQMPGELLKEFRRSSGWGRKPAPGEDRYFLFPEKLYARACVLDPQPEAFSQWLRWAAGQSVSDAESVAKEWHRIRRDDIEPLLYLMQQAERRNAFRDALSYLEKAECIDAVHSVVRAARLRLLAAGTMRHLQQKKPHLAAEKLAAMAALKQSQQGDRPAFLAALRHLIGVSSGDESGAAAARREVESLLGGGLAAEFLISGIAAASKLFDSADLPPVKALSKLERAALPALLARVTALATDLGIITKFQFPVSYVTETEAQFPGVSGSLEIEQIRLLGELGMATEHPRLAWAASQAGLGRGGSTEARFLWLRARAIPLGHGPRSLALAAAAASLGRFHRDTEVVDQAVEMVRNPFGGDSISLTLEQAREVVRKELASLVFPDRSHPGPDYGDLMPAKPCQCSDCRRKRGETFGPFDQDEEVGMAEFEEDEMEGIFREGAPKDLPPDVSRMLFQVLKEAFLNGEPFDEIMSQITGGGGGKKKGRRK